MIMAQDIKAVAEVREIRRVWIVVQAKPAQERLAKDELEHKGFEVYLPMRLFEDRKGEIRATPFFGRYLFARVTLDVERWKGIYTTRGVAGGARLRHAAAWRQRPGRRADPSAGRWRLHSPRAGRGLPLHERRSGGRGIDRGGVFRTC
jgi:hypothetical protein